LLACRRISIGRIAGDAEVAGEDVDAFVEKLKCDRLTDTVVGSGDDRDVALL